MEPTALPPEALARWRRKHRRDIRRYVARTARPRRTRFAVLATVTALVVISTGCYVGQVFRYPNGNYAQVDSPGHITEWAGYHVDVDDRGFVEYLCGVFNVCAGGWAHYWHQHIYHDLIGNYWVTTEGEWHNYLNCPLNGGWQADEACNEIAVTGVRG